MNQEIRNEINLIEKGRIKSTWYNPADSGVDPDTNKYVLGKHIYIGESSGGQFGFRPTWDEAVMDAEQAKLALQQYKSGSTNDSHKVTVDPFVGEWKQIAHEYADLKTQAIKSGSTSALKSAGIGVSGDFAAIDIINVQQMLVNTELRDFALESAVTTVATPSLLLSVDTYGRFTGQKSIGEGVAPILKLGSVARTTFSLPKDGAAIGLSFEAQTKASHDLYRTHVDNAISDLKRIKSNKIAVELELATDVAGGDWAAITSDHYTRSALDDIGGITDTIVSNNGRADSLACHDRVARDLISNLGASAISFTGNGQNVLGALGDFSTARTFNIPSTNITVYVDNEKTATLATIYDKSAIYKMQGPVRTAVFRQELEDVDMFRIFDFNLPKIIVAARLRDLTGVSA